MNVNCVAVAVVPVALIFIHHWRPKIEKFPLRHIFYLWHPLSCSNTGVGTLMRGREKKKMPISPKMFLSWNNVNLANSGNWYQWWNDLNAICYYSWVRGQYCEYRILLFCSAQWMKRLTFFLLFCLFFNRLLSVTVMDCFQNFPSNQIFSCERQKIFSWQIHCVLVVVSSAAETHQYSWSEETVDIECRSRFHCQKENGENRGNSFNSLLITVVHNCCFRTLSRVWLVSSIRQTTSWFLQVPWMGELS